MPIERKRMTNILMEAQQAGPYDELPILPAEVDPQLHVSRNDRDQPFFLVCDHDTVLLQLTGSSRVDLRDSNMLYETLELGDFLYIPAGTPHRIRPTEPSVHARFKAARPTLEGAAWFCSTCGEEVWRLEWDLAEELPQEGYLRACTEFNADPAKRRCGTCGHEEPPVDLVGFNWEQLAKELRDSTD